ncbi:Protein of unknown function DUF2232, membrane [Syntrophomonas zehnderi OL-4]|uniref:DUF2232 domain-containing protein n=1 Tax=Syntrophomonas zehnderi OL-4 TaxID=690567 RepID=A0A0E4G8X0_9FIRM|nr:DUF2232 domain-containing protein [Syntrophomonas zehnderi]CFW99946.1 Protein of unknown function DUF2232, membrane [Syntrophomonas zehnderi OL-4]
MPAVVNIAVLSSLACLAMAGLPALVFIGGIFWGISLVLGGYYLNRNKLILVFALNLVLIYMLSGAANLLYALVFYGIPSLLMAILLSMRKSYYEILGKGMLVMILSVGLFLGVTYLQLGEGGFDELQARIKSGMQESIDMSEKSGIFEFYENRGISRDEIETAFANLAETLLNYLPAFFYLQAILGVYLIILLSSLLARRRKLQVLDKHPFSEEIMPWQLAWVVIAGLACWLLGREQMQLLYYIGANILVIVVPVTVYYGLSYLVYQLQHMRPQYRGWLLALLIIVCLFFSVSAIIFIGLMGLFDSLLDYRKLRQKKEGT